jgi:tRNA uridine 5-carbamoylmethylation protein Kti12
MYLSPIELSTTNPMIEQIKNETDEFIYRAVAHANVQVDRDELIKALQYDRKQYEKGFNDGVMQERERWERKIKELFSEDSSID